MITERDPRVEPKAGDILTAQEKKSKKMVTRIVNKVENGVVYFSPQKPINLSCFIPKWKKWAAKATVVKAAPCLIVAALLLTGCRKYQIVVESNPTPKHHATLDAAEVFEREGCHYLLFESAHGYPSFIHKGNCTNHYSQMLFEKVKPQAGVLQPPANPANGFMVTTTSNAHYYSFDTNGMLIPQPNETERQEKIRLLCDIYSKGFILGNLHQKYVQRGDEVSAKSTDLESSIMLLKSTLENYPNVP